MADEVKKADVPLIESFDQIEQAQDVRYDTVDMRKFNWPGAARIRSINAGVLLAFVEANEGPAKKTAAFRMILDSMVDSKGAKLADHSKIEALAKKDAAACDYLVDKIMQLNGLDKAAKEKAKNDLGGTPTDVSPTA